MERKQKETDWWLDQSCTIAEIIKETKIGNYRTDKTEKEIHQRLEIELETRQLIETNTAQCIRATFSSLMSPRPGRLGG